MSSSSPVAMISVRGAGGRGREVASFNRHISESEGRVSSVCVESRPRGLLLVEEKRETRPGWMEDENNAMSYVRLKSRKARLCAPDPA